MTVEKGEHGHPGAYSPSAPPLAILGADVGAGPPVDVVVSERGIERVGPGAARGHPGQVVDARGGALLPGLHDHHIHLRSLAAAHRSVAAGPPAVSDPAGLVTALREGRGRALAAGRGWVRAVGYHESVAGPLDRRTLDEAVADVPVRVQHRSGAVWTVNSRGVGVLGLDDEDDPGVERDGAGRPTGRLFRMDRWLRTRTGDAPDGAGPEAELAEVSRAAAARGVTGFTEATPGISPDELAFWAKAVAAGTVAQRLTVMWSLDPGLDGPAPPAGPGRPGPTPGPVKFLLDDTRLPGPDELAGEFAAAHAGSRPVAVHCVTRIQTVVTLAALQRAGPLAGDRIEHGSVIPAELVTTLARAGTTVVSNPSLVWERGDRYLTDVEPGDRPDLYRLGSLARAGVPVAAGTDAPFGNEDPWVSIRAAVDRRTRGGRVVGPGEGLEVSDALRLFTGRADLPATAREAARGAPADLCLIDRPWAALLACAADELSGGLVRATIVGGRLVHLAG